MLLKKYVFAIIFLFSNLLFSQEKYKILILWSGFGEREWGMRIEKACRNLGHEVSLSYFVEEFLEFGQILIKKFHPDLVISLKEEIIISSEVPNYIAITGCKKHFFDPYFENDEKILQFDGILSASSMVLCLKAFVEASGKTFQAIDWYPSCYATKYYPVCPKKLFYCGLPWDGKRNGKEYRKMFALLDQTGYFEVYGPPEKWTYIPNSTQGLLPFDGKSILQAIQKAGIALLLHADNHIELEAPSSRIFEAAAACSVIISDYHPFIVKEFGDCILYVDGYANGEDLFRQINTHVQWVFAHPEEAQKMARKAHTIFVGKFTLEAQLQNLIQMHEIIGSRQR